MLGHERGDTIIEVLLAVTIFSLVAVGAMVIMNQGTNAAQRSLEITQVRQQIDAQAESLRAAQQAFTVASDPNDPDLTWNQIADPTPTAHFDSDASVTGCPESETGDIAGTFVMDTRTGTMAPTGWFNSISADDAPPYAKVDYTGGTRAYGLWIERTFENGGDAPDAYNFIIRACWYGAGLNRPLQIDTLVRLYDPS